MRRLRLVPDNTQIPFFRYRWIAFVWSLVVLVGTIVLVATSGLNLGIDFKGGVLLEVRTQGPADLSLMRSTLGNLSLGEVTLQTAGSDDQVMIRAEAPENDQVAQRAAVEQIKGALGGVLGSGLSYQRAEFVGPRVSQELLTNSVWAVLFSLVGVLLYLWFRFEWQYGIGAIASLVHDVSATIGIYALTGIEFNLTSVAAVLTIVGYSLNDTVVIYDRVRENLRRYKVMPLEQLLDRSINETLARTMMTSLTTLVALLPLWLFGGEVIRGFTIIMIWGVIIGTYSTDLYRYPGAVLSQPTRIDRGQAYASRGRAAGTLTGAPPWRLSSRSSHPVCRSCSATVLMGSRCRVCGTHARSWSCRKGSWSGRPTVRTISIWPAWSRSGRRSRCRTSSSSAWAPGSCCSRPSCAGPFAPGGRSWRRWPHLRLAAPTMCCWPSNAGSPRR